MLSTVHSYLNLKKNELGLTLGRIESTIAINHPDMSMSDTKLSKIFKDPKTKVSMEELFVIVESMGLDKQEILAILGEQEYRASKDVDYKGATELIAEFERREMDLRRDYDGQLVKAREIREGLQHAFNQAKEAFELSVATISDHRDKEIAKRDEIQRNVVTHLQNQLSETQADLFSAKKALAAASKSLTWWRVASATGFGILAAAFIYVLWEIMNMDKGATAFLVEMSKQGLL